MIQLKFKKPTGIVMNFFAYDTFLDIDKYEHKDLFEDIEYIWDVLKKLPEYIKRKDLGNIKIDIPKEAFLVNEKEISIGKNSIVEKGAYIKGPCIIGENCQIRNGAYIRGNVITGNNCIIGHSTEVKNSVFLNNSYASHFAYVGDSILGNNVNLGAGVKCANLRLDKNEVFFIFKNEKIKTGLKKLGSIIGDNVQIGCNSVLNPATFLGRNSICYPSINISGVFKDRSIVKPACCGKAETIG